MFQVISGRRGSGAEHPEDDCDSDSDYEDTVEVATQEGIVCVSEEESNPGTSATLATGAFTT